MNWLFYTMLALFAWFWFGVLAFIWNLY